MQKLDSNIDVSVVIPCLNERESIAAVIKEARSCFGPSDYRYEILVADNGSTDGSQVISESLGCRVVVIQERGYGAALLGGISSALGRYVVMADADGSYRFMDSLQMIPLLESGADLVMGNRFLGGIEPGAMPWLHRWLGNPLLSHLGRALYKVPISDFHCGLRAFRKESIERLNLRCPGMEFASEMVVMAGVKNLRIFEVPVRLFPDTRSREPHLRTWSDGWRHLRFLLVYSPRWLFAFPAACMTLFGMTVFAIGVNGAVSTGSLELSYRAAVLSSVMVMIGMTAAGSFLIARDAIDPGDQHQRPRQLFIRSSVTSFVLGSVLLIWQFVSWTLSGFGTQEVGRGTTLTILGSTLLGIGAIGLLTSIVRTVIRATYIK